jgi:hypothetical protein
MKSSLRSNPRVNGRVSTSACSNAPEPHLNKSRGYFQQRIGASVQRDERHSETNPRMPSPSLSYLPPPRQHRQFKVIPNDSLDDCIKALLESSELLGRLDLDQKTLEVEFALGDGHRAAR